MALALEQALRASGGQPILSDVAAALRAPDPDLAAGISRTVDEVLTAGNAARWAFDGLLSTVAKDLFDGPSTTRFDSTAPIVAIDLSDLYNDNANLSIAFTCASAWMEAALATPGNGQRFAVYDEAWRVLAHAHGAIDRLQQQFRLARSWGLSNVLVLHNLRDTLNVGDAGCAERNKAESLLALAGTKIIGYQPAKETPPHHRGPRPHASPRPQIIANASRGEFLVKLQTTARHALLPGRRSTCTRTSSPGGTPPPACSTTGRPPRHPTDAAGDRMTTASTPNPGAFAIEKAGRPRRRDRGRCCSPRSTRTGWLLAVAHRPPDPRVHPRPRASPRSAWTPYVPGVPPVAARAAARWSSRHW